MGREPLAVQRDPERRVTVVYRNHRGNVAVREILPMRLWWGSTEHHKKEQWLLEVWDYGKEDHRTFALKDVLTWEP